MKTTETFVTTNLTLKADWTQISKYRKLTKLRKQRPLTVSEDESLQTLEKAACIEYIVRNLSDSDIECIMKDMCRRDDLEFDWWKGGISCR